MICIIRKKETKCTFRGTPVSKEVMDFAKWYRDKLNVQQRQKINTAIEANKKINLKKVFVDLKSCIITFERMKSNGFSWQKIQETLIDELLLKGLLTEDEYNEKNNFN